MKIGVDLLWVRPGKCGGTESYARNLLEGFGRYDGENEYLLFVARDNADGFRHYLDYGNMKLRECPMDCAVSWKRILWENLHLDRAARAESVDVMFIPVYSKPMTYGSKIPYACVIHDVQALHYPQYFSLARRCFLPVMWWFACRTSTCVIASSHHCMEDLAKRYPFVQKKLCVIPIPVITQESGMDIAVLEQKYGIVRNQYFYCVSSMLPHKNLGTLLKALSLMKESVPAQKLGAGLGNWKLVLSGVGGNEQGFQDMVDELKLKEAVVVTGFVSNEERDCLYENCGLFLFPSIFEGFGMPPVEAMRRGKQVVTTKRSSLKEVTKGEAVYVEDPFNPVEWVEKIRYASQLGPCREAFAEYGLESVTSRYVERLVTICLH